jgi:N-acetylmuramoyl-L-alanine amidase
MFKLAIAAGHYLGTSGRRIPKALDENQTKEWELNDRIVRYAIEAAEKYEGVEVMRLDDPTGKNAVSVEDRCKAANEWGANFCAEIHHDAHTGNPWNGGGVTAFCAVGSKDGRKYRDAIYEAVIAAGGLRGNRATPKRDKNWTFCKKTAAPAVLLECGFMDSRSDAPVILTDEYAKSVGYAIMDGIAQVAGLKKKSENETFYCVQVGAFKKKEYATEMVKKLKVAGFDGYITEKEK